MSRSRSRRLPSAELHRLTEERGLHSRKMESVSIRANPLRGMLFGVTPFDAATFVAVGAIMLLTAIAASFIPARRATTVSPVTALRVS